MTNFFTSVRAALAIALVALAGRAAEIGPNDNRRPAGHLVDGKLTLNLEVREGKWNPEGENGPQLPVKAFAEEGQPLTSPGPLIRVPAGTEVCVTVRNLLRSRVTVHGLHAHSADDTDSFTVAPSGSREFAFRAARPGVHFYWAATNSATLAKRNGADGQLSGALIVDPPDVLPRADRIFVMTHWEVHDNTKASHEREAWAINGKSWPDTEHLTYPAGEPVHWYWLNPSDERHPLHMHGHYFEVDGSGDERQWTVRPPQRNLVATELVDVGGSIALTWTPERAGNWIFHCHNVVHIDADLRLTPDGPHSHEDAGQLHMAGLVLGVTVTEGKPALAGSAEPRRLRLVVGERPGVTVRGRPGLGYQLIEGAGGPGDSETFSAPGPPIVLTRGQPVEIAVENRLNEATSVHWHAIELESYYDGVPGWGGQGKHITPMIHPRETFIARFTPPRAGTFMYHTHLNDYIQLSDGLYGALIVLEPGQHFEPETDRILVLSRGGSDDIKDQFLVNGSISPPAMDLIAGKVYRFRMIGITAAAPIEITLEQRGAAVEWRAIAKDGVTLPALGARSGKARVVVNPGETYDFEFQPAEACRLRLNAVNTFSKQQIAVPIAVRAAP